MLNSVGARMNWSVLWYAPKKDKIIRHRCGSDLNEALRVYGLAKEGGKSRVTLYCANVGFPPPEKFQPHYVQIVVKRLVKGRMRRVRETKYREPMNKANRAGIYWCPYCREFRRFQKQDGFFYDGQWVPDPDSRGGLYCPMCGVSHRDMHVRRWNPIADRHYLTSTRGRSTSGSRRSLNTTRNRRRTQA